MQHNMRTWGRRISYYRLEKGPEMLTFLLWCLLLIVCWPIAIIALILYPIVWLLLLPFRLVGLAFEGVFELLRAIILLPARMLGGGPVRTRA